MRRPSWNRCLATILALSLTVVCLTAATRSASATTVRKTSYRFGTSPGASSYGDPDAPGGSGSTSLPGGGTISPIFSLQKTNSRTPGEGVNASKMGWWDASRMMLAQWRVTFVR